jgi:hypothetical protein
VDADISVKPITRRLPVVAGENVINPVKYDSSVITFSLEPVADVF